MRDRPRRSNTSCSSSRRTAPTTRSSPTCTAPSATCASACSPGRSRPNHHEAAKVFAHGDNYYDVGQDSFDGHFIIDSGHENEFDQKVHPTVWNANKLSPEGLYVSAPENLPLNGYMWNNLYRHNVSFRIYGEATYLLGLGPTALVPPSQVSTEPKRLLPQAYALNGNYSLTYPSQITPSRPAFGDGNTDEDRADDFLRELPVIDAAGQVPSFMFLWMTDDHTQGATPGAPTPEYEVARNDHALGRILEGLTHSAAWKDMAIFVTEDDPQDGQDHLDAHRTIQLVLSPYVKRGVRLGDHALEPVDVEDDGPAPRRAAQLHAGGDGHTAHRLLHGHAAARPRYVAKDQQVPLKLNPSAAAASNQQLAAAARLQDDVPAGLDEGGAMLQSVLRVRHEGAVAAAEPGVPVLANEVEHRLDTSSPTPLALAADPGGTCPLTVAAARPSGLPPTGGDARLFVPAVLCLALALLVRSRRRADNRRLTDAASTPPRCRSATTDGQVHSPARFRRISRSASRQLGRRL